VKSYLSLVDIHTTGNRNDVTPLFANREAFAQLAADLGEPFRGAGIEAVAAIDALGFILGTAVAEVLGVGVIPVRKGGKLPVDAERVEFVDYSGERKVLELRPDALDAGTKVLIVDEWIETGAQVRAAIELVERLGGRVEGIVTIQMDRKPQTDDIRSTYRVHTVWEDEKS